MPGYVPVDGRLKAIKVVFCLIAGAVVFIRWLHQAYKNLDVVAPGERRYGHGWAIGGWFVPFLNLWRPKQVVNDVWRGGGSEPSALLWCWWALFVISNWVSSVAARSLFSGDGQEAIRDSSVAYLVSDSLDVPGAILALLVAVAATRGLDARAAERPEPEPEPLWPPPAEYPVGTSYPG